MNTFAPRPKGYDQTMYEQRTSRRVAWLIALSLMGYPLLGTLVALTSFPSFVASVPVRTAVIFLSLSLLVSVRSNEALLFSIRRIPMTPARAALLLFWFVYICRLIWDWRVAQMPEAGAALLFFCVVGLLPALALLGRAPRYWNPDVFAKIVFLAGAATCAIAVAATLLGLAGERSLIEQTDRLAFDTVNPVTYGQVAVTTLLAGLIGWSDAPRRPIVLVGVGAGAMAALVCLQMAASKGPIVALAACILALGVFKPRYRWRIIALLPVVAAFLFFAYDSSLGQRFSGAEGDLSTVERRELMINAIAQFREHPLFGNAFLETETQTYPHNPFVEAAMATGVVGALLYASLVITCVWRLVGWLKRKGGVLLALVALQYLVGEHISGSLWASGGLWICLAMIIALTSHGRPTSKLSTSRSSTPHTNNPAMARAEA